MIAPVQERMPIYIAAIGPRNTELAAEIADGWIPTLFSPEHVAEFRPLLEAGFARAGAGKDYADFDVVPTVSVMVSDDVESARDAMRAYVALYVGGMGSRKQNFYNALVRRYGFEEAASTVQELYLEGRKDEAAAALPGELIDTVTLVGPPERVRERLQVYRDAGVGTLMIAPMAWTFEDRLRQLRLVAELAA
jgi:alkanesulfonate monooxygenase SsuD/methylene tetrahydromethanopterin reductase-like flavin-dependent oxidoreductase (luciferase family)